MRYLVWEQRKDGRYAYDVVDSEAQARKLCEGNQNLFYYPMSRREKWKKGQLITRKVS